MAGEYAPQSLSAEDAMVRPVWSILNKGFTGTGKTILSCGKEFRPVYVFDMEGRFESVLSYYKKLDGHVKDIYYNHFPLTEGFFKVDQKMDAIAARPEYKTVVLASLTSFIRNVMFHLKTASRESKTQDGKVKGVRKKGGIQANILEDFNFEDAALIDELIGFFQLMKSQGVNVIMEAHITPYEIKSIDEDTGQKDLHTVYDILTKGKKAPAELPGWFNEVWLMEKKVPQQWGESMGAASYWVNPNGNTTNPCKTSFGITPFEWTNLDASELLTRQLSQEIRDTPRTDPNAPKVSAW